MASIYHIDMALSSHKGIHLSIPEQIRVPQHSTVQWTISRLELFPFNQAFFAFEVQVTIIFADASPFRWRRDPFGFIKTTCVSLQMAWPP
jgi:hypothetical protein